MVGRQDLLVIVGVRVVFIIIILHYHLLTIKLLILVVNCSSGDKKVGIVDV